MKVIEKAIFPDRIKLPLSFDHSLMAKELSLLNLKEFIYYDSIPLRAPAHLVDATRPFPPPADDYADGSWTEWLNTQALEDAPYLKSVVDTFANHTKVTLVRILRLAPGAIVKEHTDPTLGLEIERSVIRMTIPILGVEDVQFYLNDTVVPMQLGECWYMRLTDPHRVINNTAQQRINMTIDIIPNNWVRSMLMD